MGAVLEGGESCGDEGWLRILRAGVFHAGVWYAELHGSVVHGVDRRVEGALRSALHVVVVVGARHGVAFCLDQSVMGCVDGWSWVRGRGGTRSKQRLMRLQSVRLPVKCVYGDLCIAVRHLRSQCIARVSPLKHLRDVTSRRARAVTSASASLGSTRIDSFGVWMKGGIHKGIVNMGLVTFRFQQTRSRRQGNQYRRYKFTYTPVQSWQQRTVQQHLPTEPSSTMSTNQVACHLRREIAATKQ